MERMGRIGAMKSFKNLMAVILLSLFSGHAYAQLSGTTYRGYAEKTDSKGDSILILVSVKDHSTGNWATKKISWPTFLTLIGDTLEQVKRDSLKAALFRGDTLRIRDVILGDTSRTALFHLPKLSASNKWQSPAIGDSAVGTAQVNDTLKSVFRYGDYVRLATALDRATFGGTTKPDYRFDFPWQSADNINIMHVGGTNADNNKIAIIAESYSNVGMSVYSGINNAIEANTGSGFAGVFRATASSTNTFSPINKYVRLTTGIAENGIALSNDYYLENTAGDSVLAGREYVRFSAATAGTEVSAFDWYPKAAGAALARVVTINPNGLGINLPNEATRPFQAMKTGTGEVAYLGTISGAGLLLQTSSGLMELMGYALSGYNDVVVKAKTGTSGTRWYTDGHVITTTGGTSWRLDTASKISVGTTQWSAIASDSIAGDKIENRSIEYDALKINSLIPPICPDTMYVSVGQESCLYWSNISMYPNWRNYYYRAKCDSGHQWNNGWRISPLEARSTTLYEWIWDKDLNVLLQDTTIIKIASPTINPVKVLVIGDSWTDSGVYMSYLDTLAQDSITFLGTQDIEAVPNEGYGGRDYTWFASDAESPMVTGGEFDFDYYLTTESIDTPDMVVFELGINDAKIRAGYATPFISAGGIEETMVYLDTMVANIKRTVPDVKIGICSIPYPADQDAFADDYLASGVFLVAQKYNVHVLNIALNARYSTRGTKTQDNVFIIPINVEIDTEHDEVTTPTQYSALNVDTYNAMNNALHPATAGYRKVAAAIFGWICNYAL
jgi:lysophospholipase L1-like esterase